MDNLTRLPTTDTSCPLLDKLAPETRTAIYEYVLTFNHPVKHAKRMQPFVKKLTGAEIMPPLESTAAEPEPESGAEAKRSTVSCRRVNTSILTASKLVFNEAIAVFYSRNIIHVNPEICNPKHLVSPLATDLSLATRVTTDITLLGHSKAAVGKAVTESMAIAMDGLSNIFPNLLSGNVCFHVDGTQSPVSTLFASAYVLRVMESFENVRFDGVGSLSASVTLNPCLKLAFKCDQTIRSWEETHETDLPVGLLNPLETSAYSLYRLSRADLQNVFARLAKTLFDSCACYILPLQYGTVEHDSHEFWTVVDGVLRRSQELFARLERGEDITDDESEEDDNTASDSRAPQEDDNDNEEATEDVEPTPEERD